MESYIVAITKQFFQINLTITDVPSDPVLILFGLSFKMYLFSCVYFPQFENLSCIFIKILRVFDIQKIHLRLEDVLDRIVATCYMTLFLVKILSVFHHDYKHLRISLGMYAMIFLNFFVMFYSFFSHTTLLYLKAK